MAKLNYLTVQDILWINLQATRKVQHFSYARLEEATYYQYAYGESNEVLSQAGRFLSGFMKMHPLDAGNEATAFIGMVAFLTLNGYRFCLNDAEAADWFQKANVSLEAAREAIAEVAHVDHHGHHDDKPNARVVIRGVMECYTSTIASLSSKQVAA